MSFTISLEQFNNYTDAQKETVRTIVVQERLLAHQELVKQLAGLVEQEKTLRKEVFVLAFPDAKEGTNDFALNNGYVLKGTHKINRTIDEALIPQVRQQLEETCKASLDNYIKFKPDLKVGDYKKAPPEVRLVLDQCITAKPGTPDLEIVLPKR